MAASGVDWPCCTSVKVLVVRVEGFIASEKEAVGEMATSMPVAPGAGLRAVIVGGVVSPPPLPHSTRASAQSAWSETLLSPPLVTARRSWAAPAMETSIALVAVAPVIAPES